jgi:ribosomal-protein-alanine N-acetyltransferase
MINNDTLSSMKLKKVCPTELTPSAQVKPQHVLQELDINQYEQTLLQFSIENWYQLIQDATFPTQFCPLTLDDAQLLISCYSNLEEKKQNLSSELEEKLANLTQRLQATINSVNSASKSLLKSVFVKSSSRSAKNNAIDSPNFKQIYENWTLFEVKQLNSGQLEQKEYLDNAKLTALLRCGTDFLQIHSAEQSISQLIHSERINYDLMVALNQYQLDSVAFQQNLVVRQFIPLDVALEFRCFVYQKQLRAITQYNNSIFVAKAIGNQALIRRKIIEFWESRVKQPISSKFSNYVVDVGFISGVNWENSFDLIGKSQEIYVIELNPYLPTTNAGLFDWVKDAELLNTADYCEKHENATDLPVFRLNSGPLRGKIGELLPEWAKMAQEVTIPTTITLSVSSTVLLRAWRRSDAANLVKFANNPKVSLYTSGRCAYPYTENHAETWLNMAENNGRGAELQGIFAIECDGVAAGSIGLHFGDDIHRNNATLGYWLGEEFWGQGIITKCVKIIVNYGMSMFPELQRIEAEVFSNNVASARVLEKCGFSLEGRLRASLFKHGRTVDCLVYSIIRKDIWP